MGLSYTLQIDDIGLFEQHENEVWSNEFLNQLERDRFSMTGGLICFFSVEMPDAIDRCSGTAYIARNLRSEVKTPSSGAEADEMEYRAFHAYGGDSTYGDFGAGFVNAAISAYAGQLPPGWLDLAMKNVGTNSGHPN
jgi:hypothetical protein